MFTQEDKKRLNEWVEYFSFQPTLVYKWLLGCTQSVIGVFCGNQFGKTYTIARFVWDAILGVLPVEQMNIRPSDTVRIIRCASEVLPNDEEAEVKNTQYPALKKFIPDYFIKEDITIRKPRMVIADPQGGADVVIEFVSFGQTTQQQAGVQRRMCFIDEHAPKPFYEEQIPRLMRASSDIRQIRGIDADALMIIALTPAQEFLDWEFDELFERAGTIYRTKSVRDRIQLRMSEIYPAKEIVDEQSQIAVIMASSYDNPSFDKVTVDKEMDKYADEDTKDIRGYGIFKQISGVVFKFFDRNVHVRDFEKLFQPFNGIPHDWVHARGIDFHQYNPWAVGWCCLSPQNEMFIYDELWVSPERHVTYDIAQMVSAKSKDYKYWLNLVDPLAGVKQGNTGRTTVDDLNEYFYMLYKEGIGTGGFWQTWDTKSQRGQDDIKMRLKNAKIVGRPFNNLVNGKYLPTIWISSRCHYTIEHMKNWRKEQVSNRNALVQNDPKDSAAEKYSHFNMVWEGILKSPAFSVNRYRGSVLHDRKQRREARA